MREADPESVKVHVTNVDDLKAVPTEEKEPEHFTASSFVLPALGVGENPEQSNPQQVLQLDPMRKLAYITFNGNGQVWLAHSAAQANALQNGAEQGADSGTLVTCPSVIKAEGTGPLWAIQSSLTQSPGVTGDSLYAGGSSTPTTADQTITGVTLTPPAGTYIVNLSLYVDGTVVTADDEDNFRITGFGTSLGPLLCPAESSGVPIVTTYQFTIVLNGSQTFSVQTSAKTPSGTAVYHASILMNAVSGSIPNDLIVGVLQSRRGA